MKQYSAFDAKTHFSKLLMEVMHGDKYVISKHGKNVAMLIPYTDQSDETDPIKSSIKALKKLRKGIFLGKKLSIKKMREEGRA